MPPVKASQAVALVAALLMPHGVGAEPIAQSSVAAALAELKARDGNGTIVTASDGWVVVNEPGASAQWSFTPAGHAAHPAVVRRVIRRPMDGSTPTVETALLCEGPAAPCNALRQEFEAMNDRILQSLKARGRQGSTPPR